jgi:hypothetical protein
MTTDATQIAAALTTLKKAWKSVRRAEAKMARANGWQERDKAVRAVERAEARLRVAQTETVIRFGRDAMVRLNKIAGAC